ncbi:hypothetical protein AcW1_004693 [Taiwanofungus camphoratus]|nr:hypothetical protein AcW2_006304 [Antrodia cinnamomea]KAI0938285.1 hypothetical protein AcV7_003510 [Antrodia cinnamomea]KAI0939775.1 hypothetical protein AcV5_001075 [Antrodia cinnamomea]KAI0960067.1 hypothetical protein AcW1_004693 [Antrodia cinnamomea]
MTLPAADVTHGTLVSDSLQRLKLREQVLASQSEDADPHVEGELSATRGGNDEQNQVLPSPSLSRSAWSPHAREGYGFRPPSGVSTPLNAPISGVGASSPLPDPNGLGWPAKSTVSRLSATPAEKQAREQKLAGAVRTILECIGEDPDREGLVRTPERYAQALMWMTRGYEERLAGTKDFVHYPQGFSTVVCCEQTSSTMLSLQRIMTRWSLFETSISQAYVSTI